MQTAAIQVVLSVVMLYHHLAPVEEARPIARALVRLTKRSREVEYVALANISTLAAQRPVRTRRHM